MFSIAYAFKGQVHVFAGWVKIVSHSSCRTSAFLKYFCPLSSFENQQFIWEENEKNVQNFRPLTVCIIFLISCQKLKKMRALIGISLNFDVLIWVITQVPIFNPRDLTLFRPMELSIKVKLQFKLGWSIIYIEGSQVIISPKYYLSSSEDQFCL